MQTQTTLPSNWSEVLPTNLAADLLNRAPQTLRKWACLECGPIRPIRINGRLAWRVSDIEQLLSGGAACTFHKGKKPSNGGSRYLGQQHNFPSQVAGANHNKGSSVTKPFRRSNQPSPVDFYAGEIDAFHEGSGGWASGCCPFHDDRNHSFAMNLETGSFYCRSPNCGVSGGNLVAYVCAKYGLLVADAFRLLEDLA